MSKSIKTTSVYVNEFASQIIQKREVSYDDLVMTVDEGVISVAPISWEIPEGRVWRGEQVMHISDMGVGDFSRYKNAPNSLMSDDMGAKRWCPLCGVRLIEEESYLETYWRHPYSDKCKLSGEIVDEPAYGGTSRKIKSVEEEAQLLEDLAKNSVPLEYYLEVLAPIYKEHADNAGENPDDLEFIPGTEKNVGDSMSDWGNSTEINNVTHLTKEEIYLINYTSKVLMYSPWSILRKLEELDVTDIDMKSVREEVEHYIGSLAEHVRDLRNKGWVPSKIEKQINERMYRKEATDYEADIWEKLQFRKSIVEPASASPSETKKGVVQNKSYWLYGNGWGGYINSEMRRINKKLFRKGGRVIHLDHFTGYILIGGEDEYWIDKGKVTKLD